MSISVTKAQGSRCPRCKKYHDLANTPDLLCIGCIEALLDLARNGNKYIDEDRNRAYLSEELKTLVTNNIQEAVRTAQGFQPKLEQFIKELIAKW